MDILNEFEELRRLLFSIAYRMLGSAMEAEDIVQDAFIRYQAVDRSRVDSPKAYLTTTVSRLSLNYLSSARIRRESYVGPWLPEPLLSADHPELGQPLDRITDYESISMAFLVLLENLTPAERAVFILREVFEYEYAEIAEMLARSEPACRKLFSRAHKFISTNRPRFQASPEEHYNLLARFTAAVGTGDVDGLTDLLSEQVSYWADGGGKARGAALNPIHGRDAVMKFVLSSTRFTEAGSSFSIDMVNGQPAAVIRDSVGSATTVIFIEISEGIVQAIRAIANPDKLRRI